MHRLMTVSLGSVSGLALRIAFAVGAIPGSFYISPVASSSADSVAFPNCTGATSFIGDGNCDASNNNVECGYDGGDCCECSCVSTTFHLCGRHGFYCVDPEVGYSYFGCEVASTVPPAVSPCVTGIPSTWVVENKTDAYLLAESMLCSGGVFDVEWKGFVPINRTLYVIDGTVLHVMGSSDAVADGGGNTQLFSAFNGVLLVSDMQMSNGSGIHGGAISATQQSEVTLTRVNFGSNTADGCGGAVRLHNSSLMLADSSDFTGNRAVNGGAICIARNSTFVQQAGKGEVYRFINNTATCGGALYVSGGSTVGGNHHTNSTNTGSAVASYSVATKQYASEVDIPEEDWHSKFDATFAKTYFRNNSVEGSGGAVYMDEWSRWVWRGETVFKGNSAEHGGALLVDNQNMIQWQGVTLFAENHARKDGGAIASAVDSSATVISMDGAVRFLGNTCGTSGGALALFGDVELRWGDAAPEFSGNSAALSGGAVYISGATYGLQFVHARFTQNHAKVTIGYELPGGFDLRIGAVYSWRCGIAQTMVAGATPVSYPSNFSNCEFVENSAKKAGGAIEIYEGRAHIRNTIFSRNTARVGGALRLSGTAKLLNTSFSQNVADRYRSSAISNSGLISEMRQLNFSGNLPRCSLSSFLYFHEGVCNRCDTPCQGCIFEDNTTLPICRSLQYAYSLDYPTTIEGAKLSGGYWRSSDQSWQVLQCFNADACADNLVGDQKYCKDGYKGPYCAVCSKGYTAMPAFTCNPCPDRKEAAVIAIVALTVAVLVLLAFVWHMVSIEQNDATHDVISRLRKVLPLQSIKTIVVTWQLVTQSHSVAHVIYPEYYQIFLDNVAAVNFDMAGLPSAGCLMYFDFHVLLLVATVGPIAVGLLLGVTYAIAIQRNCGSEGARDALQRKHVGVAVLTTFFVYSTVSSIVLRTFSCDDAFDDGSVYLRTDYRIECNSTRHKAFQMYASVMILVYPVGIPMFYALLLYRDRKLFVEGLDRELSRYQYTSVVSKPYRPSMFYYEIVECSRRILITLVIVWVAPDTSTQIAVITVVAFSFMLVSEALNPYAFWWDRWTSRAGHVTVVLSGYVALLTKVDTLGELEGMMDMLGKVLVGGQFAMLCLGVFETMASLYSIRRDNGWLQV